MPSGPETVAVFGATGTVGRATALALRDRGTRVIAAGRTDPKVPGVTFAPLDVRDSATLGTALASHRVTHVISCLASRTGAPRDAWTIDHDAHQAILQAAQKVDVERFVLLSAICVQKPRLAFQHAKLAFEETLKTSGLDHVIVRPTALFKSLSGQVARVRAGRPYLMFGDGRLTACKPISDRDVAAFLVDSLTDPARRNRILPIGGPGAALTPRQIGQSLFRLTGQPPRYRRVPPGLLRALAAVLAVGGQISPRLAARAELARIGHYYATESMLVWDPVRARYDAATTPSHGSDTLEDYHRQLLSGTATLERGDHAVF